MIHSFEPLINDHSLRLPYSGTCLKRLGRSDWYWSAPWHNPVLHSFRVMFGYGCRDVDGQLVGRGDCPPLRTSRPSHIKREESELERRGGVGVSAALSSSGSLAPL